MSFKEKILNQSSSYLFYKERYEELKNSNKQLSKENKQLLKNNDMLLDQLNKKNNELLLKINEIHTKNEDFYKDFTDIKGKIEFNIDFFNEKINKINHDFIERDNYNRLLLKELQYSFVLNDSIRQSEWLKYTNLSLINSASNYSFIYCLYRILNDCKPQNILELGLGQTTKLTTQYVNFFFDSELTVFEGDSHWIDVFSKNLQLSNNIKIVDSDLEIVNFNDSETLRFKDMGNVIKDQKFDLIIIDGPNGFITDSNNNVVELKYSRTNILELIPNNLSDEFIIIIDDYNREGEQNTIDHVKKLLNDNNLKFNELTCWAYKTQHIIFTDKYKFISWI